MSDLDQRTRAILEAADSPTHVEADPRLDWPDLWARVEDLGVTLAKIAGRAFELDRNVQDATFPYRSFGASRPRHGRKQPKSRLHQRFDHFV